MNQQKKISSKDSFFDFLQQIEVGPFSQGQSKCRKFTEGLDLSSKIMNFQKKTRIFISSESPYWTFFLYSLYKNNIINRFYKTWTKSKSFRTHLKSMHIFLKKKWLPPAKFSDSTKNLISKLFYGKSCSQCVNSYQNLRILLFWLN